LLHEDHGPNVTTVGLAIRQQLEHEQQHPIEFLNLPAPAQEVLKRKSIGNLLEIAVGAPVRITRNIDITRKMVNGAAGVVADLRFKHNVLTSVKVQLENGGKIASISRMTPVCVWTADRKLVFQEFPLMLNYAGTVHSVQGCTLTKNIFTDIECFAPGLGYVALSRNTNLSQIRIKRMPSVEDLRVISPPV
jgi:ATP-dependent exoDNAse (exonuclease V) alpha subunit